MWSVMMMICGSVVLRGSRPRLPAPRVTISADVGVGQLVVSESVDDRGRHLLAFHRNLEMNSLGRFVEPIDVLLEPEDPPGVSPDPLEHAVAVEQAMIEDADLGVGLVVQLAADVDLGAHLARSSRC